MRITAFQVMHVWVYGSSADDVVGCRVLLAHACVTSFWRAASLWPTLGEIL